MNKTIKLVVTILSGITIVSTAFAIFFYNNSVLGNTSLRYANDQAFAEVTASMSKLDSAMNKLNYSTSNVYTITMLTEVYGESRNAKANLSLLPIEDSEIDKTSEFMSKVGDYSLSLIKKVADGQELTDDDISNITMFTKNATSLANEIAELQSLYNNGELNDFVMNIKTFDDKSVLNTSGFEEANQSEDVQIEMQDFATLVYDGPFSAHINQMTPLYLEGKDELSEEEALKKAKEIFQTDDVTFVSKVDGQIPCYKFNVTTKNREISLDMTVAGGYILNMLDYRAIGQSTLSVEECIEKADEILKKSGFTNFAHTYYTESNGIITINYAFSQDDVVVYPDLVKVSVYMDDGTLRGVETRGFIMSHTERIIDEINISIDEAKKTVSTNLEILSEGLAIVPTSSKGEVLTYEFKCKNEEDKHYIVYVNAVTGSLENILILIEDETGTLTI